MILRHKLRWKIQHWLENRVPGMLTCDQFETAIDAYIDGELDGIAKAKLDFHVMMCPPCRRYLRAFGKTRDLAVQAMSREDEQALEAIPEELVSAIIAARGAETGQGGP